MKTSDFFYDLPETQIAQYPLRIRSKSRLLCLKDPTDIITHKKFQDLAELINPHDLLILNNTKVIPARLYGEKETGGKIEILIEKIINAREAWVHCRASKRPKIGQKIFLENHIKASVTADHQTLLKLYFEDSRSVLKLLLNYGHMPLPPYLHRADNQTDRERYQTVYAKTAGSAAAPTAGLHFNKALLKKFHPQIAYVTLHVGAGTFQPVRTDNIDDHRMHTEYAEVSQSVCDQINKTRHNGGRIIAVGTTTVRTLESACLLNPAKQIQPFAQETNLFIKPGFKFQCVDAMITNFHLPESTLLMLVCAFGGYERVMTAYQSAIKNGYRFYSYGDAMFLTRR